MRKFNRMDDRFFVTGTDTGIGKTVLSLLLMQYFFEMGENPFYVKPIQTGCKDPRDTDSDSRFINEHVHALRGKDPSDSVAYCFKNPKAPYFAARDEGRGIDLAAVRDFVDRIDSSHSPIVIEGAGGVLVPVTEVEMMADLIGLLRGKPILAARAGLGTINHTLLSLEVLRGRGMEPIGIVFMDSGEHPTPIQMIKENMEAIERHSGVKVCGVIGKIRDFSAPPKGCFEPLRLLFQGR